MSFEAIGRISIESPGRLDPPADLTVFPLPMGATGLQDAAGRLPGEAAAIVDSVTGRGDFAGEAGRTLLLHTAGPPLPRVLLAGMGAPGSLTRESIRRISASALRQAQDLRAGRVRFVLPFPECALDPADQAALVAEGAELGAYRYLDCRTVDRDRFVQVSELLLSFTQGDPGAAAEQSVKKARVLSAGVRLARDLTHSPGNLMTPEMLAGEAGRVAAQNGLALAVMDGDACRVEGMNAFLGVAGGSSQPPRFIRLDYDCGITGAPRIGLVGKGITFDSGGISIKPRQDMHLMKFDMAGAAAIIGAMSCLRGLEIPVHVTAAIPAAENLPGGRALKPGDVLRAFDNRTIEVLNTDAEGRLILADALAWMVSRVRPAAILDMATLTTAVFMALGRYGAGFMSNDDGLAARLAGAAERSGERVWRLPLWEELSEHLKSDTADLRNIADPVSGGGALMAAAFLRHFVGVTPWVHVDIAGAAWSEKDRPLHPKGASGYGVRLVVEFVRGFGEARSD